MTGSDAVIVGGKKNGLVAVIEANVPPLLKALTNDVFAPDASWNTLPALAGDNAPATWNEFRTGGVEEKLCTRTAGNESPKMPIPPRTTVLLLENGLKVKPKRGCHTTPSVDG